MVIYLLKSGACLAGFYLFYKWFLENESIHNFKRFYLLGGIVLSLVIPLITITTYVEATPPSTPIFMMENTMVQTPVAPEKDYLPLILYALYGLGVIVLSIRFVKNLMQLSKKIAGNTKLKRNHTTIVLVEEPVIPHTFLGYIFLEKLKFETGEIPEEVLLHEQVHAKQKHSLDLLFIELVQLLFWFNPLLLLYKKSIKLNHEFLADRVVLRSNTNLSAYQNLLLAFSSNVNLPSLANAINYSFIKKRFTVMKKQTSPQAAWLRSLFVLPLLAILFYGFSSREIIEKAYSSTVVQIESQQDQDKATKEEIEEYNALAKKYNAMSNDKMHILKDEIIRMSSIYHKMTLEQRKKAEPFPSVEGYPGPPPAPDTPPRVTTPPVPPTPPVPTSMVGLIEEMQNKNAVFIYNSKEISAEEALDIAKNKKINSVSSCIDKDGKYEVVLFSE